MSDRKKIRIWPALLGCVVALSALPADVRAGELLPEAPGQVEEMLQPPALGATDVPLDQAWTQDQVVGMAGDPAPWNVEELKKSVDVTDPRSVAIHYLWSISRMVDDRADGLGMMKYLFADIEPYGPGFTEGGKNGGWVSYMDERLSDDAYKWLPRAYFEGASAENGFDPARPLALSLRYDGSKTETINGQSFEALGRLNIVYWAKSAAAGNQVNITLSRFAGSERWYVTDGSTASAVMYQQRVDAEVQARAAATANDPSTKEQHTAAYGTEFAPEEPGTERALPQEWKKDQEYVMSRDPAPWDTGELEQSVDVTDPRSVAIHYLWSISRMVDDRADGLAMMKYLFADIEPFGSGYTAGGKNGGWESYMDDRLSDDAYKWLPRAYFEGATAENGFAPERPLSLYLYYNGPNTETINGQTLEQLGRLNIVYWVRSAAAGNQVNITLSQFAGSGRWYVTNGTTASAVMYQQTVEEEVQARAAQTVNDPSTEEAHAAAYGRDLREAFTIGEIPDQIYTGSPITPALRFVSQKDGTEQELSEAEAAVSYVDNIHAGRAVVAVEGRGSYRGTLEAEFRILPRDIASATVSEIGEQAYTGGEIRPAVTVTDDGTVLAEGVAYSLAYRDNLLPGTGRVVVTGLGDYAGTLEASFAITGSVKGEGVSVEGLAEEYYYTGSAVAPEILVYDNDAGTRLREGVDYTVAYANNKSVSTGGRKAKLTVSLKGNYSGKIVEEYSIRKADLSAPGVRALVIAAPPEAVANGRRQELKPDIYYAGKLLKMGRDYELAYPDSGEGAYTQPGTWRITVTGAGSSFEGSLTMAERLFDASERISLADKRVSITYQKTLSFVDSLEGKPVPEVTCGGETLAQGVDYTWRLVGAGQVGTASLVIAAASGSTKYYGSVTKKVKVTKHKLSGAQGSGLVATVSGGDAVTVAKNGVTPPVEVAVCGRKLAEGRDYKVSYSKNKAAGEGLAKITGMGDYTGTVKVKFSIGKQDLSRLADNFFVGDIEAAAAKKDAYKKVKHLLYDLDGGLLRAGADYTVKLEAPSEGKARITLTGKKNYEGSLTREYRVLEGAESIQKAKVAFLDVDGRPVKKNTYTYTGGEVRPDQPAFGSIRLTIGSGKKASVVDPGGYEVVHYANNIKKGTGTIVIRGRENSCGLLAAQFKIASR